MNDTSNANVTEKYYDSLAKMISRKYPQGYQVSMIKNDLHSNESLLKQNYEYLMNLVPMKTNSLNADNDWIIDCGCGNGQFYDFLRSNEKYRLASYFGIDISEKQIENANQKAEGKFSCASFENFATLEPEYNHCFFLETIGYATDLDVVVKTTSFILHMGGYVIIKNPMKIVNDPESDNKYCEEMKCISDEYGFSENSLGMIVDKKVLEDAFLSHGFELYKFETPEIDVETYNKTFLKYKTFSKKHPKYVNHVIGKERVEYNSSKNKYYECAVLVFKKVEDVIEDFSHLPQICGSYTSGIEQSRNAYASDPTHPNAPYLASRSNQISYGDVEIKNSNSKTSKPHFVSSSNVAQGTESETNKTVNLQLNWLMDENDLGEDHVGVVTEKH